MGNNFSNGTAVANEALNEIIKSSSRGFTYSGRNGRKVRESLKVKLPVKWNKLNEEKGRDEKEVYNILETIGVGSIATISKIKKKTPSGSSQRRLTYGCIPRVSACCFRGQVLYALKKIDLSSNRHKYLDELRNEIDILKALDHPNILRAFETFEKKNYISIVMELCDGGDLRSRQPYTEKQAATITNKITSAVAYMHENNIVHRDLKCENIMFESNRPDAEIKIIDFGLSKRVNDHDQTMKGQIGSVYTMAPEVIKGKYTIKADIWSVGVLSFMLLSANEPFPGTSRKEIEAKILKGEYSFDDFKWKDISKKAKDFVSNLIKYDPEKRFTAREAQEHAWLKLKYGLNDKKLNNSMMEKICQNLVQYPNETDFKKLTLNIIAHTSTADDVSKLRQAFDQFDSNKDGTIKYSEFKEVLSQFKFNEDEIEKSFRSVNINNNGGIWYTEFVAASIEAQGSIDEGRLGEAFDRLDREKKGHITKDDLTVLLGNQCSEELARRLIKEVDSDGDGQISYKDFLHQFRQGNESFRKKSV